jgi:polysaccharide deacetylase family protein (PEP-CTERM system associated)
LSQQNQSDRFNPNNYFLLTVDVEDWFQVENFKSSIRFDAWEKKELRVERNTQRLLDLIDNTARKEKAKATFFVLGWIAKKLPGLVREIHARGHEVASHGINHRLCTKETADNLKNDLYESRVLLEDLIGSRVSGYRAPSFAIDDDIIRMIQDAGYRYDSSYNSFGKHGRYGKLSTISFQKTGIAYRINNSFWELPVSNLYLPPIANSLRPMVLPWGGGGYFRLLPYALFKRGIERILKEKDAYNFYIHPWEVDPGQPILDEAPPLLKFRHYVNLSSTALKVGKMLADFSDCHFVTCEEYLESNSN